MKPVLNQLSLEDTRHLRAAEGWLELGDFVSASNELEEITAQERAHPAVLSMRYAIYSKAGRWEMAADVANGLIVMLPGVPDSRHCGLRLATTA